MSSTMMIDSTGRVTRSRDVKKRDDLKKQIPKPSFAPDIFNDDFFVYPSQSPAVEAVYASHRSQKSASQRSKISSENNHKNKRGRKKSTEEVASFAPSFTVSSMATGYWTPSTLDTRSKKGNLALKQSSSSSHQTAFKFLPKRVIIESMSTNPLSPSSGNEEENQPSARRNQCISRTNPSPKNRPWNKRVTRRDSHNSGCTTESLSSRATMQDKYAFMSYRFPITSNNKKVIFTKKPNSQVMAIENGHGQIIGCMDYSMARERKTRLLKDTTGRTCALIQEKKRPGCGYHNVRFRVYGDKPAYFRQAPVAEDLVARGCYLWAEIKNSGKLGGNFVMKRYHSETSVEKQVAKRFGSLFSKDMSKGFTFVDSEEKECVKMFSLKDSTKGILIAPDQDMCLMLAFCGVVDEMVEKLLL